MYLLALTLVNLKLLYFSVDDSLQLETISLLKTQKFSLNIKKVINILIVKFYLLI